MSTSVVPIVRVASWILSLISIGAFIDRLDISEVFERELATHRCGGAGDLKILQ